MSLTRVLFVDDEPNILEAVRRSIRGPFELVTAYGGEEGLRLIDEGPPFTVVVSDLRMPVVDGLTLLTHVYTQSPETIRILLTGHADLDAAVNAVNNGQLFRFLTKPCPGSLMRATLKAAIEQHRLISSERILLQHTLRGSIRALSEMISLVHPAVSAHTSRVRRLVVEIGTRMQAEDLWRIEVATMLAHLGWVTLPPGTVAKLHRGLDLTSQEAGSVLRVPEIAAQLLANIPRMEEVQTILMYQNAGYDGVGSPVPGVVGERIPLGARLLKAATDYDVLEARGLSPAEAMVVMQSNSGSYDCEVLRHLGEVTQGAYLTGVVRQMTIREMQPGMVFGQDVLDERGLLLVARGQEASESLLHRLHEYQDASLLSQRVLVMTPGVSGVRKAA
ncbi:MAG: response regulator [Candidatus Eisenbacteria bacterium]|nr:response regulator [Candidatus Eisenbacteria bacterium]